MSGGVAWMECVWKMRGSEWLQVCVGEDRGGEERLAKNSLSGSPPTPFLTSYSI